MNAFGHLQNKTQTVADTNPTFTTVMVERQPFLFMARSISLFKESGAVCLPLACLSVGKLISVSV